MKLNYKAVALISLKCLILGIFIGWKIFPNVLEKIISNRIALKPGSHMRQMWSKTPFPLDFNVYVFNITNPFDVEQGKKPILKEIGPYYFEEWKSKENLIDDDEKDTISYNMQNKFIFHPEKSNGLNGNEIISIPHPLVQGISIVVKRKHPGLLNLVKKAMKLVFPNDTAILTTTFLDIFFNGIFIDCSAKEFAAKALCTGFSTSNIGGIVEHNQTHYRFSLLGSSNATNSGKYNVFRGINNIHELGEILDYKNENELNIWNGKLCNQIKGTDGTIFPPFIKLKTDVWVFSPELCRSMKLKYMKNTHFSGISVSRYHIDLGNIAENEELQCFCNNPPHDCPINGTMNLMSCLDAPIIVSMPHFYNGASQLFENVIGLEPNESKHQGFLDFEMITSTPLNAAKRLQFNFGIEPVDEIDVMKSIRKMILPIFWIEEKLQINKTYIDNLKHSVFLAIKLNEYLKWSFIASGIFGLFIAIRLYMKNNKTFKIDQFALKQSQSSVKSVSEIVDALK